MTADEIIAFLGLQPHPEGGHYRQTFRAGDQPRGASTAIYFLLKAGERSHWHRVDADEVWHHYAGAPLELSICAKVGSETKDSEKKGSEMQDGEKEGAVRHLRLGTDLLLGELPQAVVPRNAWQAARSLGRWTLVGCTVAPAFDFKTFELAPPGWSP